jgi:hypothetical protein
VLALVCYHAGVDEACAILAVRRPEATDAGLAVEEGHVEGAPGRIVEQRLGSNETGWPGTWFGSAGEWMSG